MSSKEERLKFLARIVDKEAQYLQATADRLFSAAQVTPTQVQAWVADTDVSERLDAFVARYGRLQDTLGDKLIPALLAFLGESIGPAMDNLDKAERFGWIKSADVWIEHRKLRNQMIHEYIEDPLILADALDAGRRFVKPMIDVAQSLIQEVKARVA